MNGENLPMGGTIAKGELNLQPVPRANKKIFLGIGIALFIVVLGGVAALAAGLWNPSWNPFGPSPDKVLKQAFENMAEL